MWSFPKNLLRATLEKAQSIFRRGNSSVLQELQDPSPPCRVEERRGKPFPPRQGWRKLSLAGSWWGLALRAPRALQGMRLHFAEAALGAIQVRHPAASPGTRRSRRNRRSPCFCSILPPLSAPCFTFSPSRCFFGTLLPGRSHPLGVLGTKQTLTVTQSTRNPSRNAAAKAVFSGKRESVAMVVLAACT